MNFVVILFIPILILFLIFVFLKNGWNFGGRIRPRHILIGYATILLISSLIVIIFIPKSEPINSGVLNKGQLPDLWYSSIEGDISKIDSKYKKQEWDFDLVDDSLSIQTDNEDGEYYNNLPIHIEKTEELDKKIEVTYYLTLFTDDGQVNLTKYISSPEPRLSNDNLIIKDKEEGKGKVAGIKREFPITQFMKSKKNDLKLDDEEWYFLNGEELLYIRVPDNIKLEFDEEQDIQYIESNDE